MNKIYDISIKKTIYGFRQIKASNEEEARQKIEKEIESNEELDFIEDNNKNSIEILGIEHYLNEN